MKTRRRVAKRSRRNSHHRRRTIKNRKHGGYQICSDWEKAGYGSIAECLRDQR